MKNINFHVCSLLHFRFKTSVQVAKIATKHKPFDLCRRSTGLCRVAEMFHNYWRFVAKHSFLFCLFGVDPALLNELHSDQLCRSSKLSSDIAVTEVVM